MEIGPEKKIFRREEGKEEKEEELKIAPEDWEKIQKKLEESTREVKEKYVWELEEITRKAKKVGFEKVLIGPHDTLMVYLEHPEIVTIPKQYLDNYHLAKEVIAEYLSAGLKQLFLEARSYFEKPKKKIWQKIIRGELELKKIVDKKELEERQKKIEKLKESLKTDFRKCLSGSEIESEVMGKHIDDILCADPERMESLLEIYQMKERSPSKYQEFYDERYPEIRKEYQEKFPYLYDEATSDKLAGKYFEIGEKIGEKYWKYLKKEEEYGDFKTYR